MRKGRYQSGGMMGMSVSSPACPSPTFGMMTAPQGKPKGRPMTEDMRIAREVERSQRAEAAKVRAEQKRAARAAKRQRD